MRTPRKNKHSLTATQTAPCLILKAIRERAGVTAAVCAKACDLSSPNSFYRYESTARMADTAIPDHIIEAVMPLLVGKGSPPVTADELMAISSAHRLLALRGRTANTGAASAGRILPQPVVAPVFPEPDNAPPLIVRARAEKGVFMSVEAFRERTFGAAPISVAKDVRGEQFAVLVADNHAGGMYSAGATLHCVSPSAFSPAQLVGRRVVMATENNAMGLVEVSIGKVVAVNGNTLRVEDANGKVMSGTPYGVIIGSYARE